MDDDGEGITFEQATGQAAAAPAPTPTQDAPVPGARGRQIIVHERPKPKAPPAPIAPHEAAPLSVQPDVVAPPAEGQEPPQPSKIAREEEGVPFEQVAPPRYPGLATDIGKGIQGGLAEGVEGLLGAPFDVPHMADYGLAWAGAHVNQALGGENAQQALQRTHGSALRQLITPPVYDKLAQFIPTSSEYQKEFRRVGIDPNYTPQSIGGRYAHEIASFLPGAAMPFGEAGLLTRLGQSVGPAVGSETLGHAVQGTGWEPAARLVGAGFGGLGQAAGTEATTAAKSWAEPLTTSGQLNRAARDFQRGTDDPDAALQAIRQARSQTPPGGATGENIPGSKPTTAQITGDYGQADMERQLQMARPAEHAKQMHAQRGAQTTALKDVQTTGAPETVADMITQRLQQIDQNHEAQVEMAQQLHETGQQLHEQGVAQAEAAARGSTGQVARQGAPESLGERARGAIAQSMAARRAEEKRLWDAIGAEKIGVRPHQIGGQARKLQRQVGPMQKPMEGDEKRIFDNAAQLGKDVTRLSDVTDLTSDLKTAMRKERMTNGKTPALARMTQLLKTAENVIKNAATRASAKEAEEDMGRLRAMTPQDRANIMAARAKSRERGDIERGPAGAIIRQGATADSYRTMDSQVPGKIFAKGPTGYQKAKAYADATGKPWLDPFKDIVSDSLARSAAPDGVIDPAKLAKWQQDYGEALRALPDDVRQNYVKGPAEAAAQLAETAAQRRAAMVAHGKIDIVKQMGKTSPEAAALRANPAFKAFEGLTSADDVQRAVSGLFSRTDSVTRLGQLRQFLAQQPDGAAALDGLKRATLDHVIQKVISQSEAGTTGIKQLKPGTMQKLVADDRGRLAAAGLDQRQLAALDGIAADIERQQRFFATKAAGQSNTPQDLFRLMKKAAQTEHGIGFWGKLFAAHETGGLKGAGLYLGTEAVNHMRHAGIEKAEQLLQNAVLNPDQAEALLTHKAPMISNRGWQKRLSSSLQRNAMYGTLAAERHQALDKRGVPGRDIYVNRRP